MKILILSPHYFPNINPRAHRWTSIAEHWAEQGHEVHVICSKNKNYPAEEDLHKVQVYRTGFNSPKEILYYFSNNEVKRGEAGQKKQNSGRKGALMQWFNDKILRNIYFPDDAFMWYRPAKKMMRKLLKAKDFDLLISSSVPFTTHLLTDTQEGEILVRWIAPKAEDLDTLLNPGPYRYQLMRSEGVGTENFTEIAAANYSADNFYELTQTEFTDTNLNTLEEAHTYKIDFYINGEPEAIVSANKASSVFLTVGGADERTELTWDFETPWENSDFVVFKEQEDGSFVVLDTVQTPEFTEEGLVNGREYCYYIESIGSYSVEGIPAPLFNKSQRACGTPLDTVPPCPPTLTVRNICDEQVNCVEADLVNNLTWTNPNFLCEETDDVVSYNVYFADQEGAEYNIVHTTENIADTTFAHMSSRGLAGCYAVTAVDSFANESLFSNIVCVDNCPIYELPNAFTPNDDGQNDVFIPYPFCFIDRIEIAIFNRWGQQVFAATDPNIAWTGKSESGENLSTGTYYYTCRVFEQRVANGGETEKLLSGFIELLRE